MIHVPRLSPPSHLASVAATTWTHDLCEQRRQYYLRVSQHRKTGGTRGDEPKKPKANSGHYGHPSVRETLTKMFGPKCAYCEAEVDTVGWQHVEHFRPTSRYPALAYEWDNLLLACGRCNSEYKSDRFPIGPAGNSRRENRKMPCLLNGIGETALLLNPCVDRPEQHITFRDGKVVALTESGNRTRKICALNRATLVRSRQKRLIQVKFTVEQLRVAITAGDLPLVQRCSAILVDLTHPHSPFAGMVRAELARMGIDWQSL